MIAPQIKKLYKVPEFPSKRLPNWRSRGLEQRRQGLEAYIQVGMGLAVAPSPLDWRCGPETCEGLGCGGTYVLDMIFSTPGLHFLSSSFRMKIN